MKLVWKLAFCLSGAIVIAIGATGLVLISDRFFSKGLRAGPWRYDITTGSQEANLYQRAKVAVFGLWALRSSEVLYLTAQTDSGGSQLSHSCSYRIEGRDLPARWWSIAAYNNFHFIPNSQDRYSFNMNNVHRNNNNSWTINFSSVPQKVNWLSSGSKAGVLILSLRLYNPQLGVIDKLKSLPLPQIVKEKCS
jgi:hypothetical protein